MSSIKEIRLKIDSIRNIQKIASAMEMIAASKMYKSKRRMLLSRPYTEAICKVIEHISVGKLEYRHSYFVNREIKGVGYWVISTDRGLTGGLNINLFRELLREIRKWSNTGVSVKLSVIGAKAIAFFSNFTAVEMIGCVSGVGDYPKISNLIGLVKVMLQLYDDYKVDRVYLAYNKFVNTLSQIPKIIQILPIVSSDSNMQLQCNYWDYLYEPNSRVLLNSLLQRYVESQVYQGVIENLASEQSARMIAMKNAADNGESLISNLRLLHNKIRQNKITQELSEIIIGSSVV